MFCLLLFVFGDRNLFKLKKVDTTTGKTPFLTLKNEEGTYVFYDTDITPSNKKIQCHNPFLIQAVRNLKEPITYVTKKKIYQIYPFDKILMIEDEFQICLGVYKGSFLSNDIYWQEFQCGDVCDLNSSLERISQVSFKGMVGKMRVDKFYEKRLCEYVFYVGGEELVIKIDNIEGIEYQYQKDKQVKENKKEEEL